jgi:sporulation protein YlmC with PRC-barrel domain
MTMKLVRDVLDKQLVDRTGRECGKVDGLVLVTDNGEPPRVAFIECGSSTLARRIGRRTARFVSWLARRFGPRHGAPVRIPWSDVLEVDVEVKIDVDAERSPLDAGEAWSRDHVVAHIPGA